MSKKLYYFLLVELPNQQRHLFRTSNDLRHAFIQLRRQQPAIWKTYLNQSLINIPIDNYYQTKSGHTQQPPIVVGKVIETKAFKIDIKKKNRFPITRSQFIHYNSWFNTPIEQQFNYLKHDYPNTKLIQQSISYWHNQKHSLKKMIKVAQYQYRLQKFFNHKK